MEYQGYLIAILVVLYIFLIARYIYNIIISYDNCNAVKTISWIFAVVFFSVLGVIAYIIVGRNLTRRNIRFEKLRREVDGYISHRNKFVYEDNSRSAEKHKDLKHLLTCLCELPVFPGNKVDFYANGEDKFRAMYADFETATKYIHIIYYTIGGDETGIRFKDHLIKKHRERVEVRIIYDDVGCNETPKHYFEELKEAGILITPFSPVKLFKSIRTINYRNHKKIVVIDGDISYTGGMNVKDEYVKGLKWRVWRDTHVRIQGPASLGLESVFLVDWYYAHQEHLDYDRYFPRARSYGEYPIQVMTAEPFGENSNILQGMFETITRARKSVYIETPYFVPPDSILTAIRTTALSGIEVVMVLPDRSDNAKVQYASNSYISQLLSANVKVYRYTKGFIHSKLMVIDDEITIVGSSNMDTRSFELNFECSIFIYDTRASEQAKNMIHTDIQDSYLLTQILWEKRTKWQKFVEAVFRLFSPLL